MMLQLSNLEVWFQRPKDIVRKLISGDLDLGIVGLDTVQEFGQVIGREWRDPFTGGSLLVTNQQVKILPISCR